MIKFTNKKFGQSYKYIVVSIVYKPRQKGPLEIGIGTIHFEGTERVFETFETDLDWHLTISDMQQILDKMKEL